MTVLRKYNDETEEWELIVAGKQGPSGQWDTAQPVVSATSGVTLSSIHVGALVTVNSSPDVEVVVDGDLNLLPGQRVDLLRLGTGEVTVSPSGAFVNSASGLRLRARYSSATLVCVGTDTYVLVGDLKV